METDFKIDIKGIDKAQILLALYNNSVQLGLGLLHDKKSLTIDEAKEILQRSYYIDYLNGTVMKIDLKGDTLDTWLYDRDNGKDSAWFAIKHLLNVE